MANQKILALTKDGRLTNCTADPDKRGIGRCNHVAHQEEGETDANFAIRVADINFKHQEEIVEDTTVEDESAPITQEEILKGRERLFELLGTRDVTNENLLDIINDLSPQKQNEIFKLGFEYSSYFAFPINFEDEEDKELGVKIQLSNMGDYGLGAKQKHIDAILNEIGDYVTKKGIVHIDSNFKNGVDEDEWWNMMYATRRASINKTVSVAEPGAPICKGQLVEIII